MFNGSLASIFQKSIFLYLSTYIIRKLCQYIKPPPPQKSSNPTVPDGILQFWALLLVYTSNHYTLTNKKHTCHIVPYNKQYTCSLPLISLLSLYYTLISIYCFATDTDFCSKNMQPNNQYP